MISAGFSGILRVWDVATAACVHTQPVPFALQEEPSERSLSQCQFVPARNEILTVSVEHNIVFYDAQTLQLRKQVTALSLPFPLSMLQDQLCFWKSFARGALGSSLFWNCSIVPGNFTGLGEFCPETNTETRKQNRLSQKSFLGVEIAPSIK